MAATLHWNTELYEPSRAEVGLKTKAPSISARKHRLYVSLFARAASQL